MSQTASKAESTSGKSRSSRVLDTRGLGASLRAVYEAGVDKLPIPDSLIDVILRLRSKERSLRRAG